jgi:nitrite reductase/ring-hydroxylating ferredoxin subunit
MTAVDLEPQLTQTAASTPLGRLLRCFWLPFAIAADLTEEHPIRPVRLLGEDLVVFRDTAGEAGLIQARCPHGGYALELGSVEETGIVCARHGWHFDLQGNCFVVNFTGTVYPMAWAHARTYPVQAYAGLLWAYLGPAPAPSLPDYPLLAGAPRIETASVVDRPWLAAREALTARPGVVSLLLPIDDTHTWLASLTVDSGATAAATVGDEPLRESLRHALARIEAGADVSEVAAALDTWLIGRGSE